MSRILIFILFLAFPSISLAMGIDEYRAKIERLILLLEEGSEEEVIRLSMELFAPKVEVGKGEVEVKNDWLLEENGEEKKIKRLRVISLHLARFTRVSGTEGKDPNRLIKRILSSKDYQRALKPNKGFRAFFSSIGEAIGDFIDRVINWFYKLRQRRGPPEWILRVIEWWRGIAGVVSRAIHSFLEKVLLPFGILVPEISWPYIFLGILVLTGSLLLIHYLRRAKEKVPSKEKARMGELTKEVERGPKELLLHALRLERDGDYLEAIRRIYLAILSYLNQKALIRFTPSKTNGEYIRELTKRTGPYEPFRSYTLLFDTKRYGRRPTRREDFLYCLRLAKEIMEKEG